MPESVTTLRAQRAVAPLLTLGGIAAAFGLASCCALPMVLFFFGIGTAWLGGIGLYAALHETMFLVVATIGLLGGAAMLMWQRRRFTRAMLWTMGVRLVLGAVMLWAGLTYV
jgi:mercuric ion transport protein